MIRVIYRLSDGGYNKEKPDFITNETCLRNILFSRQNSQFHIICDNVYDETFNMVHRTVNTTDTIERTDYGSGAQSFRHALDLALKYDDDDIVYFVEDDYVHMPRWEDALFDGLSISPYCTLYDHPDKYVNAVDGGNPFVEDGGEVTRLLLGSVCWWKLTNSTTMTFASTVKVLRDDFEIFRRHTEGTYPRDFDIFIELRNKGRGLVSPIPSWSTHGETKWLSKSHVDFNGRYDVLNSWETILNITQDIT